MANNNLLKPFSVNDPPKFVSANMSTNSATTEWTFETICKPQAFLLKFTSDNESFTTVKQTFNPGDEKVFATVNGLLAFTNYSFQGAIENRAGLSNWSDSSEMFPTKAMGNFLI